MKVIMVVAHQGFRDEELFIPKEVLEKAGHTVLVASTESGDATGKLGGVTKVDLTLSQAGTDADALVFVGGPGCRQLFHDPTAHRLLQEYRKKGKVLGSICSAGATLAYAGILKDKKATSFPTEREDLEKGGAQYEDATVVIDDRIVTANGPEAAEEFGLALNSLLS